MSDYKSERIKITGGIPDFGKTFWWFGILFTIGMSVTHNPEIFIDKPWWEVLLFLMFWPIQLGVLVMQALTGGL